MTAFKQDIRFARTQDGVRIAYAVSGRGYPLVRATHWLTNVELDFRTPIFGPQIEAFSARYRLYRYNARGYGLSEGAGMALSLVTHLNDLEAAIDAAGHEQFALYGSSGGGPVCIAYAARHPERVSHLVLVNTFARGILRRDPTPEQEERFFAMLKLVELGWGEENPAFRQMFTSQFFPGATLDQQRATNELQRLSASGPQASRYLLSNSELDVSDLLGQVACPTLVANSRGDARVPFEEGRILAAGLPNARFVSLPSDNHIPLPHEPAFRQLIEEIERFLPAAPNVDGNGKELAKLSHRERQVLELIARGRDNAQIAATLGVSDKTIRNHITSIFGKLEVENRSQAIVLARDAGLGTN